MSRLSTSVAPDVLCLSRNLAASPERRATFVHGSLETPQRYAEALGRADTVVHLAARARRARPRELQATNGDGTRRLLEACAAAGVRRFLYVSCATAGHPREPHDALAQSKRAAEALVRASNLEWTILRSTLVLGYKSPTQRALTQLASGRLTPMFCAPGARVQPIWSDDLADVMVDWVRGQLAARITLELGGPETLNLTELLTRISRVERDRDPRFVRLPLGATRAALALLSKPFAELAPAAPESLNLFRHGSVAAPDDLWRQRAGRMVTIQDMLQRFKEGPDPHPFAGH